MNTGQSTRNKAKAHIFHRLVLKKHQKKEEVEIKERVALTNSVRTD